MAGLLHRGSVRVYDRLPIAGMGGDSRIDCRVIESASSIRPHLGGVAERLNVSDLKSDRPARVSGVRIPSPPFLAAQH